METHLERLRRAELIEIKHWFSPEVRVLEIGGGNGFQASIIASCGCEIKSLDIPNRVRPKKQYYPVHDYNGKIFPFSNDSFDRVFSSSVL